PQLTLTQEDVDQLVQDGIAAAIKDEHERVKREATRAEGPVRDPVKFATATLHGRALTWWNSQVATLGREVANARSWAEVKQMMTDEFCPTEEVQRLEDELRHLKIRNMNIAVYTERFNKLALLCPDGVLNEKKKVELYIKVGMDWLVERDALIVCGRKEVHVPYKNKTLVVKSDSGVS
nr:putative reverse transcriptase domain-containing protein [Tanacetum cinerariifolium]